MEMQDLVNMMLNSGIAVVVLAYALWKDYKFTNQMNESLTKLSTAIEDIKDVLYFSKHNKEEK